MKFQIFDCVLRVEDAVVTAVQRGKHRLLSFKMLLFSTDLQRIRLRMCRDGVRAIELRHCISSTLRKDQISGAKEQEGEKRRRDLAESDPA